MKAILFDAFGDADVLHLGDAPRRSCDAPTCWSGCTRPA